MRSTVSKGAKQTLNRSALPAASCADGRPSYPINPRLLGHSRWPSARLAWLLLALVLATSLAPSLVLADEPAAPLLGINVLWPPGEAEILAERFRKARALGLREVRIDWEWRVVEPEPGRYRWDRLDDLVEVAADAGIELLPIVHYAPDWALPDQAKPADIYEMAPREVAFGDYARFVLACIERYGPGGNAPVRFNPIRAWQIWNEPNTKQFWGPAPNPTAFTQMMRQLHETLAPVRDQVQIVHAGLAKADLVFMWQLWEADDRHGETFDIMAVHPYLFDDRDGVRAPSAMDADVPEYAELGFIGSPTDPGFLGKVFNLQLFMTLRDAPDKPVWITEFGYLTGRHRLALDEDEQAERLTRTIEFVRRRLTSRPFDPEHPARNLPARVQRLYWFALEDYPAPRGLGNFGLFREDGSERPAAEALRTLAR